MPDGSNKPDPVNKVREWFARGADNVEPAPIHDASCTDPNATSFTSADMVETPISLGGSSTPSVATQLLHVDADGKLNQPTMVSKAPTQEGILSIVGDRLRKGEVINFGDYELIEEVGRGGMGIVFRARQVSLNRIVALKVILLGQYASEHDLQRFQVEAKSAASLRHEGIVRVYSIGEWERNPYFSMDFIHGTTLAELIANNPIDPRHAARILSSLCGAIQYAHDNGIIHRDLKPGNVLVDKAGRPHVSDFGLAKRCDTVPELTGTGQVIGTPNYMSPEQASGLHHLIRKQSDVYSLGAILYSILAGKPPFYAATIVETLKQVASEEPVPLIRLNRAVDRDLETITLKCLQKNPADRYQTAFELQEDIERYLNHEPIEARATTLASRICRWCLRNPVVSTLSFALAGLLIALAIGGPLVAYQQSNLQSRTRAALERQSRLGQKLNESTILINGNLVKMYTGRGHAAMNAGNLLAALPSFTAALKGCVEAQQPEWAHRFRVGSILQRAPEPIAMWELPAQPCRLTLSKNRRLVAIACRNGDMEVWDTTTQQRMVRSTPDQPVTSATLVFFDNDRKLLYTSGTRFRILDLGQPQEPILEMKFDSIIRDAKIDAAGGRFVVGTRSGKVQVHDLQSGDLIHLMGTHDEPVTSIALSTKANRVVSASEDNTAMLFDLRTGDYINHVEHEDVVNYVVFDAAGETFATCSDDNTARLLSAENGRKYASPIKCSSNVLVARFDPSGTRIVTGTKTGKVQIWSSTTSRELKPTMRHDNSIKDVKFNADGSLVLSSSSDHTSRIWDTRTAEPVCPPLLHSYIVESSFFMPDDCVLTISGDRMVRNWKFRPHVLRLSSVKIAGITNASVLSHDSSFFMTGGTDGILRLWDAKTGQPRPETIDHGTEITSIALHSDDDTVALGGVQGNTCIYRLSRPKEFALILEGTKHDKHAVVGKIEFSADGSKLLIMRKSSARLCNVSTAESHVLFKQSRELLDATLSADGKYALTCSRDRMAMIWDTTTGQLVGEPLQHDDYVESGVFSPNSKWVVTVSRDQTARVWKTINGQPVGHPLQHNSGVVSLSFAPDGQSLVTGSRDGIARIWRFDQLDVPVMMTVGLGSVQVKYSPNGKIIATSIDNEIQLWSASDGQSLGTVFEHEDELEHFEFSADTKFMLARSEDNVVKFWRLPTADMRPIQQLKDHVELISGRRADFRNGLKVLTPRELKQLLHKSN